MRYDVFFLDEEVGEVGPLTEAAARLAGLGRPTRALQAMIFSLICASAIFERDRRMPRVLVSLRNGAYAGGSQCRGLGRDMPGVVRMLKSAGLLFLEVGGRRGGRWRRTSVRPTPRFRRLLEKHRDELRFSRLETGDKVEARDPKTHETLEAVNSEEAHTALKAFNELIARHTYTYGRENHHLGNPAKAGSREADTLTQVGAPPTRDNGLVLPASCITFKRLFHGKSCSGAVDIARAEHGRFYSLIVRLRRRERRSLLVDGEEIVELDISGSHPSILYALEGIAPPPEMYRTDRVPAWAVKPALLISLNAASYKDARGALEAGLDKLERKEGLMLPDDISLDDVLDAAADLHQPIRCHMFTGAGRWLMTREALIVARVLAAFVRHARECPAEAAPVLPVHDSFLVPVRAEARLYREMCLAWRQELGVDWDPRVTRVTATGEKTVVSATDYAEPAAK